MTVTQPHAETPNGVQCRTKAIANTLCVLHVVCHLLDILPDISREVG